MNIVETVAAVSTWEGYGVGLTGVCGVVRFAYIVGGVCYVCVLGRAWYGMGFIGHSCDLQCISGVELIGAC